MWDQINESSIGFICNPSVKLQLAHWGNGTAHLGWTSIIHTGSSIMVKLKTPKFIEIDSKW